MPQPTPYERQYSFVTYQAENPSDPLPANEVEAELNAVKVSLDETQANIAKIQRDDGQLANNSVGLDQLAAEVTVGVAPATAWAAHTDYSENTDTVFYGTALYRCSTSHTSGVSFDGSKWEALADFASHIDSVVDDAIADLEAATHADAVSAAASAAAAAASAAAVPEATVADGAVTTAKLASNAVTTVKITDANVTTAKIASAAITNALLATDAVTQVKMADASVGTAEIIDANVTTAKLASNAVTTVKITDANVTTAKIADAAITAAKLAAGALNLNYAFASKTDTFTTTSASPADVTGMSVTITPKSASSKILLLVTGSYSNSAVHPAAFILLRGSTHLGDADVAGVRATGIAGNWTTSAGEDATTPLSLLWVDSPATTSPVTYKIQIFAPNGGTVTFNRSGADTNNADHVRNSASIFALEITS